MPREKTPSPEDRADPTQVPQEEDEEEEKSPVGLGAIDRAGC